MSSNVGSPFLSVERREKFGVERREKKRRRRRELKTHDVERRELFFVASSVVRNLSVERREKFERRASLVLFSGLVRPPSFLICSSIRPVAGFSSARGLFKIKKLGDGALHLYLGVTWGTRNYCQ